MSDPLRQNPVPADGLKTTAQTAGTVEMTDAAHPTHPRKDTERAARALVTTSAPA